LQQDHCTTIIPVFFILPPNELCPDITGEIHTSGGGS
jgi:hypothetical protein